MINYSNKKIISFLVDEIGLEESSIELGIKLSINNNSPLPILLWSYGLLTIQELDELYRFLFQNTL
tara:strand:- start:1092 stop:1289 length:198 start_codon:yes stop_codon:yes gene_type:complete